MVNRHQLIKACGFVLLGLLGLQTLAAPPARTRLEWYDDIRAAHRVSVTRQKPMLLVFHADWCGYCKKLERSLLARPQIVKYINTSFVPVHLDLDKEKRIAEILEVKSIPCSIVLSPDADLLGKLVGYVEPDKYHKTLQRTQRLHAVVQQAQKSQRANARQVSNRQDARGTRLK